MTCNNPLHKHPTDHGFLPDGTKRLFPGSALACELTPPLNPGPLLSSSSKGETEQ